MKTLCTTILFIGLLGSSWATSTINSNDKFAYGANIGWLNAAGDVANGAVIGEYVCSGYIWSANCGWIHLGDGTPVNAISYQNNSASDFGVNHDGLGNLRGFAYGANIGWINFENTGAPRVDLKTGNLSGSVWSANCGWIGLAGTTVSNIAIFVQTDTIQSAADTDGDGIADAWEKLRAGSNLNILSHSSDADNDSFSDYQEYLADTDPLNASDKLRITEYSVRFFGDTEEVHQLTWTSRPTRLYRFQLRDDLKPATQWFTIPSLTVPDPGPTTTVGLGYGPSPHVQRYLRIEAVKPLAL